MSARRLQTAGLAVLAVLHLALPARAPATQKWGPLQLSGNVQSQNLIRHPTFDTYEFVQQRNTVHVRLDYDWLQAGKLYNKYDIPFIENSHLFLLWRGVYDSIYDYTPGYIEEEDVHYDAYGAGRQNLFEFAQSVGRTDVLEIGSLAKEARDRIKFENQLRELYVDIKFRGIPLSIRGGRQQIVWGETDNFRMLDRANSLDLTWHFIQEFPAPAFGWDAIRRPFWMIKFLYDLGDIWSFSQNFLEWYWNPGDWFPAKLAFMPRPWGVRFLDPLRNPIDGAFIGAVCNSSPVKRRDGLGICTHLLNNTRFYAQGDYDRNALENSQVGVRFHSIAPFGLEFTLNYFYQRWAGDDGTPSAPLRGVPRTFNTAVDNARFRNLISQAIFPAEYYAPYVHTIGFSANYSDEQYTQAVFRFETVYDVGIPFFDLAKVTLVDNPSLPGITKKNMWKGMIAFDRPTWIRPINKKTTVFITGQFFWHYIVNHPDCQPQTVANLPPQVRARGGSCLVGPFDLPSSVRPSSVSFRDKVREFEAIATLAAFTFYRGGSIVPTVGTTLDPINDYVMEPFWSFDYVVRDDFVININQRYFFTPRGAGGHRPIFDPWGQASMQRGRSETGIRLTYQF